MATSPSIAFALINQKIGVSTIATTPIPFALGFIGLGYGVHYAGGDAVLIVNNRQMSRDDWQELLVDCYFADAVPQKPVTHHIRVVVYDSVRPGITLYYAIEPRDRQGFQAGMLAYAGLTNLQLFFV